jgi:hypothetical protein
MMWLLTWTIDPGREIYMANHRKQAQHPPEVAAANGGRRYWLVEGTHPYSQGVFSVSAEPLTADQARERFGDLALMPLDLQQAQFDILEEHLSGDEEGNPEEPLFT